MRSQPSTIIHNVATDPARRFKVAIVGGGLAGLTLALHLDKLGVDFILLEAHDTLTPNIGASIGLAPNGLRILQQLGCYDDFMAVSTPVADIEARGPDGKLLYSHRVQEGIEAQSGGYCLAFAERFELLRILLKHLSPDVRGKMLTGQRVVGIDLDDPTTARLHVEGNSVVEADMVVGADGVHSFVRSEMWRIARQTKTNAFAGDMGEDMPSDYGCIFGISHPTGGAKAGDDFQVHKKDAVIGVVVGPGHKCMWFIFFKLARPHRGLDLPRLTKADEQAIVGREMDTIINDQMTFGDVYRNCYVSVPTVTPEHCFDRWHHDRIVVVGDAVAKMNPIAGQGGCQLLESCVCLVDELYGDLCHNGGRLSGSQLDKIFARVTAIRLPRVKVQVQSGVSIQRMLAWASWPHKFIDTMVLPYLPTFLFVAQMVAPLTGAYTSTTLGKIEIDVEKTKIESESRSSASSKL